MSKTLIDRILELNTQLEPVPTGIQPKLEKLEGVRCVAFDIYGTLLISASGDIGTLVDEQAADLKPAIVAAHQLRKLDGVEFPEVDICAIWRELLQRDDVEEHAIEFESTKNPIWPMPGMQNILEDLNSFTLGIVSNAQFYTPLALEAFLGAPLDSFGIARNHCVWSYQLLEAKPSPRLFERLLAATQIPAEQTLYVGNDMLNDVWSASQVGIRTALFAGDKHSLRLRADLPQCAGLQPDLVITDLDQLVHCLSPG